MLFYVLRLAKFICADVRAPAVSSDDADMHIASAFQPDGMALHCSQSRGLFPKR